MLQRKRLWKMLLEETFSWLKYDTQCILCRKMKKNKENDYLVHFIIFLLKIERET